MSGPQGKKVRFVHPPRTSGSSITRAWGINSTAKSGGEYKGHKLPVFPKPEWEWRYGFTRNPWDRAVSLYHLANPHAPARAREFQAWIAGGMDGSAQFGERFATQLALPTLAWLAEADFVGRFENRQADIKALSRLLDRQVPKEHIAASPERLPDYRDYYDEASKLYIAERYVVDVEAFSYTFEGV